MFKRLMIAAMLFAVVAVPQVTFAARRGRNIPFVITSMGPIRKSDYYAHLMSPQQRAEQRKLEDAFIEQQNKAQQAKQPTNTQTRAKK